MPKKRRGIKLKSKGKPLYFTDEQIEDLFQSDVLDQPAFQRHIKETAHILGLPYEMVHDIVMDYFWWVIHLLNQKRTKAILQIHIYGWLVLHALIDPITFYKSLYYEWIQRARKRREQNKEP